MPCRKCSGKPPTPYIRPGLPTIHAWGPFPNHEPVPVEPPPSDEPADSE